MKYIVLIIVLLVMGCLIPEEKVVGTYAPFGSSSRRIVLLENGVGEGYKNGKKNIDYLKWSISEDGELHIVDKDGDILVLRINKDGNLTEIATIPNDRERIDTQKGVRLTFKKIK